MSQLKNFSKVRPKATRNQNTIVLVVAFFWTTAFVLGFIFGFVFLFKNNPSVLIPIVVVSIFLLTSYAIYIVLTKDPA